MESKNSFLEYAKFWRVTGKALDQVAAEELRAVDNRRELRILCREFNQAILDEPPSPDSGLVRFQMLLSKLRPK